MAAPGTRRLALGAALLLALPVLAAGGDEPRGPAYLVYAGPYSSSPSSAFGHLFLVLAPRPDTPPPLWRVVTFNAVTHDAGPVRTVVLGIAGGFSGRFDQFAFHQKTREYELLEDRDLWLLELRLDPGQREALERTLARDADRSFPYTFFGSNCAHHLQATLAEATGALPPPGAIASPTGVFRLAAASSLAGGAWHRPSATQRIDRLSSRARGDVVARLRGEPWKALAADGAWLERLTPSELALAQEVFALRALRSSEALPDEVRRGLGRLRLLRAGAAADEPAGGPGEPIPAPPFHGYPRLRLLHAPDRSGGRLFLALRGAMHDGADPWEGHQPASTMELLSVEGSLSLEQRRPHLESAVLFSQRSLRPFDWAGPRTSWLLEAQARSGGLFGRERVHLEARGGLGVTWALPGALTLHALATLAAVGAIGQGAAPAPGLEAGLLWLPVGWGRAGATWSGELDLLLARRTAQRARIWGRIDLGAGLGLLARADLEPVRSFALGLDVEL